MKAIILAAGKGKRLQPYTKNIPKCLLTLDKETILEHQINHLKSSEIQEINVVVGFGSDRVEQFLSNYDSLGIKINTIYNPFWEFPKIGDSSTHRIRSTQRITNSFTMNSVRFHWNNDFNKFYRVNLHI